MNTVPACESVVIRGFRASHLALLESNKDAVYQIASRVAERRISVNVAISSTSATYHLDSQEGLIDLRTIFAIFKQMQNLNDFDRLEMVNISWNDAGSASAGSAGGHANKFHTCFVDIEMITEDDLLEVLNTNPDVFMRALQGTMFHASH